MLVMLHLEMHLHMGVMLSQCIKKSCLEEKPRLLEALISTL